MTRLALLLTPFLGLVAGCRGAPVDEAPDHEVRISVAPTPPLVGPARIVVEVRDAEGRGVEGARATLTGDMTHAGMVPIHAELEEETDGRYSVSDFDFTMGGDWILTVRGELPDGRRIERSREVRVVSSDRSSRAPGTERMPSGL